MSNWRMTAHLFFTFEAFVYIHPTFPWFSISVDFSQVFFFIRALFWDEHLVRKAWLLAWENRDAQNSKSYFGDSEYCKNRAARQFFNSTSGQENQSKQRSRLDFADFATSCDAVWLRVGDTRGQRGLWEDGEDGQIKLDNSMSFQEKVVNRTAKRRE